LNRSVISKNIVHGSEIIDLLADLGKRMQQSRLDRPVREAP
jgi:hypothetical protein